MPYGDGTGPAGMGPMTGRAAGYCAGYAMPGYLNRFPGKAGFGRGGGGGWRNRYYATGIPGLGRGRMGGVAWGGGIAPYPYVSYHPELTTEKEAEMLRNQARVMQEEITSITERIKELEKLAEKERGK